MSLINFFNLCYILKNGQNFLFLTIYEFLITALQKTKKDQTDCNVI